MNLYPREILNKVEEISIEFIQRNKLKALQYVFFGVEYRKKFRSIKNERRKSKKY